MGLVKMQATDVARPPVRTSNFTLLILGVLALTIPAAALPLSPNEEICAETADDDVGDILDDISLSPLVLPCSSLLPVLFQVAPTWPALLDVSLQTRGVHTASTDI